jgi:DNA-binding response OmpR family regulator
MQVLLIESFDLHPSQSILTTLEEQGLQVAVVHTLENVAEKIATLWPNVIIFRLINSHPTLPDFQGVVDPLALDIPYIVIGPDQYLPDVSQGNVTLISQHHLQTLPQEIKDLTAAQKDRFIRLPNLVIDFQQRQVLRNQKRYGLTPKEFKLLSLLVDNCEQVLSRKKDYATGMGNGLYGRYAHP